MIVCSKLPYMENDNNLLSRRSTGSTCHQNGYQRNLEVRKRDMRLESNRVVLIFESRVNGQCSKIEISGWDARELRYYAEGILEAADKLEQMKE